MRPVVLLLLPLLLFALVPSAAAEAGPGANARWVESSFDLTQPTIHETQLSGELRVHKYLLGGVAYSARELSESYSLSPDATVANIESAVRSALSNTLLNSFPQATREVTGISVDRASFTTNRQDDYNPPVRVTVTAKVSQTSDQLGFGSYSDAAVESLYRAGAVITSATTIRAEPGDDLTFVIHPPATPSGLVLSHVDGGTRSPDGKSATIRINNLAGGSPQVRAFAILTKDAAAKPPTAEDVTAHIEVTLGDIAHRASTLSLLADVSIEVAAIDLDARAPGALPSNVNLKFASADALRDLARTGALDAAQVKNVENDLTRETDSAMTAALRSEVDTTGNIVRADLEPAASGPIEFQAISMGAYQMPSSNVAYALDIGASLKFSLAFAPPKHATDYVIHAPSDLVFTRAEGASVAQNGRSATFSAQPGQAPREVSFLVRQHSVESPTEEDASIHVTIDLKDLSTTIGGATSGDFGALSVGVTATGAFESIRLPDEVKTILGDNVEIDFLTSEGIRLAKENGLLSEEQLDQIERMLLNTLAKGLSSALGQDAVVTGGFAANSLSPGATGPVAFVATSEFDMSLGGSAPQTAAISLYSLPQSFTFPRVRDLDTSYTIILPRGLSVRDLNVEGGDGVAGESNDGREQFTITPNGQQAHTTMSIAVTPTFVLVKFWPVVLLAVVLLFLLVGTPIALLVLRRRKRAQ